MSRISYWQKEKSMSDHKARLILCLVKTNVKLKVWSTSAILEDFTSNLDTDTLKGSFVATRTYGFGTSMIHFEVK
jgi:hypothetical protein